MSASKPPAVVAVVEDDPPARTALGRLLWAAGFEPVLFDSAEAYLEGSATPACIIVDVHLPGMSGIELQQRLRAAGPGPPIIVTTSDHQMNIRDQAQQNGCAAFFLKPVDGHTLTEMIASLANR
jgi:FixJ family two-component response regulator